MMAALSLVFVTSGYAQFKRTAFNHVGLNVGAGTEGISLGVATPVTNFLELEAGVNVMPGFKVNADVDLETNGSLNMGGVDVPIPVSTMELKGDFARTTFNVKANVYPLVAIVSCLWLRVSQSVVTKSRS